MKSVCVIIIMSIPLLAGVGCEKADRTVRHYREISMVADDAKPAVAPMIGGASDVDAPAPVPGSSRMPDLPPEMRTPSLPLDWDTPAGWENQGSSGMRIATLLVEGQECTILSFPGGVGGDEANIRRWLGQLGHTLPDDRVKHFVANPAQFTTAGGYECRLFDYADLLPSGASPSTLVGIITIDEHSAFVKLTGNAGVLARQKNAFEALCRSIRMKASPL